MNIQELSNKELYALCKQYGKNARKWSREFGFLLPEVAKRHMYRKYRCTSIFEFAAKLAGMSHDITSRILNLSEKLKDKPLIWKEFTKCGWSKLEVIAKIMNTEAEIFWLDKIRRLPKAALVEYVRKYEGTFARNNCQNDIFSFEQPKTNGALNFGEEFTDQLRGQSRGEAGQQNGSTEYDYSKSDTATSLAGREDFPPKSFKKLKFRVDAETEFAFKKFKQAMEKEKKETLTMGEILKLLLKKVAADSQNNRISQPLVINANYKPTNCRRYIQLITVSVRNAVLKYISQNMPVHRKVSSKIQKSIIAAYNGMCAFSGCNEPYSELHHPDRFSLNTSHQRIYPLCRLHHQLAHAGLIKNEELTIENWQVDFEKNTAITGDKSAKLSGMEGIFSMYQTMEKKRVDQMVRDHWQA